MEKLRKYIGLNGRFVKLMPDYDEELCQYFYESTLSVVFNNKYYSVKKIDSDSNANSFKDLQDKLINKIIIDMGQMCMKEYFDKETFTLLHRGNCKDFFENSLEALEYAVSNYDGFETDIRLTKDDYWVVNHDKDCKRLHKKDIVLIDTNLEEIKSNTKIPELKKLLFTNDYDNKLINIEIKELYTDCSILSRISLINILLKFRNRILISSFDWNWYFFIDSYNIPFAHLVENIDILPIKYSKLIVSKVDYQTIILNNKNISIHGVYGSNKPFDMVEVNIIDL